MAQWNITVCVCARLFWILLLALGKTCCKKTETYFMEGTDCEKTRVIGGATVYSHVKAKDDAKYEHNTECRMTFEAERNGWKLMMRLIHLDIPDKSYDLCNDALYVYDSSTIVGRPVLEAGGTGGLCGRTLPPVIISNDRFLTVYFRTDNSGLRGKGFKFIITAFNDGDLCSSSFQCGNRKCIDMELLCDSVDNCGDFSDESEQSGAKCRAKEETASFLEKIKSFGVTAAIVMTFGTMVVFVSLIVCFVCCCRQCVNKKRQEANSSAGSTTTTTATSVTINNGAPFPIPGHPPYAGPYIQHGYYPMHHVSQPPGVAPQGQLYSPFTSARDSFSHSGSMYSSTNQAPPSYHRAHTPTSSRSGRSRCSNESIKYAIEKEKVTYPAAV